MAILGRGHLNTFPVKQKVFALRVMSTAQDGDVVVFEGSQWLEW
jgi:hypothetical protein